MKKIVITGMPRSGGSMVARLFDSHPDVMSYPWSPRFGPENNFCFPLAEPETLADFLKRAENYDRFKAVVQNRKDTKQTQLAFDSTSFLNALETNYVDASHPTRYLEQIAQLFFEASLDFLGEASEKFYLVWHTTNLFYGNLEEVLDRDNEMYIIHLLRLPYASYASWKSMFAEEKHRPTQRLDAGLDACQFNNSLAKGLALQKRYGARYQILRYEDLVEEPEACIRHLIATYGLNYDPILLLATILGKPWSPNTFYQDRERKTVTKIQKMPLKFPQSLHPQEIDLITKMSRGYLEKAGYSPSDPYVVYPYNLSQVQPLTSTEIAEISDRFSRRYEIFKRRVLDWEVYYPVDYTRKNLEASKQLEYVHTVRLLKDLIRRAMYLIRKAYNTPKIWFSKLIKR